MRLAFGCLAWAMSILLASSCNSGSPRGSGGAVGGRFGTGGAVLPAGMGGVTSAGGSPGGGADGGFGEGRDGGAGTGGDAGTGLTAGGDKPVTDGGVAAGGITATGGSTGGISGTGTNGTGGIGSNGTGGNGSGGTGGTGLGGTGGTGLGGTGGAGSGGTGGTGSGGTGGTGSGGTGGAGSGGTGGTGSGGTGGTGSGGIGGPGSGGTGAVGHMRRDGACQVGMQYPAPSLTGTPKQIYQTSSSRNGTFEGPVWLAGTDTLLFSDISFSGSVNPSQLFKLVPPSSVTSLIQDGGTNGHAVDGTGNVYGCSHKIQGIVKLDVATATLTTVVDKVGGKRFNSPNDLVIRSDGTIYFTDPDFQLGNRTSETGTKGIYRVDTAGVVSLVDDSFTEPNGIALSPDETVLYVADYGGNAVRTFAVAADGSTSGRKSFVDVSTPDGFAMDCAGNLYVATGSSVGAAIQVYAPSGAKLGSIALGCSNLAFGGTDGKTLYITGPKALYSLDMNLPGYHD
jgi:gluconolactonase